MLTVFVLPNPGGRQNKKQARSTAPDQARAADHGDSGSEERKNNPERNARRELPGSSPASEGDGRPGKKKNPRNARSV